MKIFGVEFDVEADWDRDGRIDKMSVFIGEQEVSEVLDEKVLDKIEQELYRTYEGPNVNEDDPREDR